MRFKLLIISTMLAYAGTSFACSKITNNFGDTGVYTARTTDLCIDLAYDVAIYPQGMKDTGQVSKGKQLEWTSKYASIMVRENEPPLLANIEGVNEKGLGVNLLYLGGTQYEKRDINKPGISMYVWAKYVMDNYATVDEVLASLKQYQLVIEPVKIAGNDLILPMHFSIEDATGDNAIIEFLNGEMKVFHSKKYGTMTNEPSYDKQLANLAKVQKTSNYSKDYLPGGANSANRFVRAYFYSSNLPKKVNSNLDAVEYMFSAISGVFVPYYADYDKHCGLVSGDPNAGDTWPTQWATLTDQKNRVLYLIDGKSGNQISVHLDKFNVSPGSPVRTLNPMQVKLDNDVSDKFTDAKL